MISDRETGISRLSPDFAVAPQLRREDLAGIAASGFRTVVNNRPDGEAPDQPSSDEIEAAARQLGLDYIHIPIVPGQMDEAQARELDRFLSQAAAPVLAFCRSGNRSAQLWNLSRQLDPGR
ncbi:MAG: TIGR01244 family sulfur transferase [Allosphingosinicella sp.]